jgi:hypothetical protein
VAGGEDAEGKALGDHAAFKASLETMLIWQVHEAKFFPMHKK